MGLDKRQINDLKDLGLLSLIGGSGLAIYKHLNSGSLLADRPAAMGATSGSMVEVPVPGQSALPGTSEFFENRRKNKIKGKAKNLGTYKPGKNVALEDSMEKGSAFDTKDLYNPAYLPSALAATAVPMVGGYALLNHILTKKVKDEKAQEVEEAKNEFGKALVESHSNRIKEPVRAVKAASLAEDLETLAELHSGSEKQAENPAQPPAKPKGDPFWNLLTSGVPNGLRAIGDKIKGAPGPTDILGAYGGALGALGLGLGAAGIYTGYQNSKKNDTEKLESQRYLNEFLNRRAIEGSPIYSVPVPVKVNQKKNTLRAIGNPSNILEQEA